MVVARDARPGLPDGVIFWSVVLAAWALAVVAAVAGWDDRLHHDALAQHGGTPGVGTLLRFLLAWQVMTAAMMLPSSLSLIRLFARASGGQTHPRLVRLVFLAAYFAVWTGFAMLALAGDAALHQLAHGWPWLRHRPWLIGAAVLVLAGAFQFSPLKERCLRQCRSPFGFLRRHYRRGVGAAWELGVRHGLFCLGCCWALMLVMVAVGVGHLALMAGLTGVMVIEKTWRRGRQLAPVVGVVLLAWGALVLAHPSWLPAPLSLAAATTDQGDRPNEVEHQHHR
jgi:predicted metal-binding membrane protein